MKKERIFTEEERAAMREYAREKRGEKTADGEADALAKIAEMAEPDLAIARCIDRLAKAAGLSPRTWYGMPAYSRDGKVLCFFQSRTKFKTRYATLGFTDSARLDEGEMWPTSYAVGSLTPDVEARISALITRAVA